MRVFTKREREYLERLKRRNVMLVRESSPDSHKLFYKGLSVLMSASERKMRERIRRKALLACFDLVLAEAAGVFPHKKLGVKSIQRLMDKVEMASWFKAFEKLQGKGDV